MCKEGGPAPTLKIYRRGEVYHAYFRANGRTYRESARTTDRDEALLYLSRRYAEEAGNQPTRGRLTLGMALTLWAASVGGAGSQGWPRKRYGNVRQWVEHFGSSRPVSTVRSRDLSRYADERTAKGMSPSTISKEFSSISSFFAWLQHEEHVEHNPVQGARRPPLENRKKRGLDIEQVRSLFAKVGGHPVLEPAYLLAYTQGLRRSEIVAARFEHVDLTRQTIYVQGSKTDLAEATLPLHPKMEEWLRSNWHEMGPIVRKHRRRPGEAEHFSPTSIENYRKDANLRGLALPNWHLGRHSLASILVQDGVDIYTVCKLLRHAQVTTTHSFYAHLKPETRRAELARLHV